MYPISGQKHCVLIYVPKFIFVYLLKMSCGNVKQRLCDMNCLLDWPIVNNCMFDLCLCGYFEAEDDIFEGVFLETGAISCQWASDNNKIGL